MSGPTWPARRNTAAYPGRRPDRLAATPPAGQHCAARTAVSPTPQSTSPLADGTRQPRLPRSARPHTGRCRPAIRGAPGSGIARQADRRLRSHARRRPGSETPAQPRRHPMAGPPSQGSAGRPHPHFPTRLLRHGRRHTGHNHAAIGQSHPAPDFRSPQPAVPHCGPATIRQRTSGAPRRTSRRLHDPPGTARLQLAVHTRFTTR